ncbi:unnamed protein product, partial [Meganyctiphanes norvegica]
ECRVREKYSLDLWNGDQLKILAYVSEQDGFMCILNFHGLDNDLFYDQIVLSNQGNKVIKTNDGNIENLYTYTSVNTTGWMEFTFSIGNNSHFLVNVWDELVLSYMVDFPIKTITTYARNTKFSLCSKPSWAVGENEAVVIPLNTQLQNEIGKGISQSSIYITLASIVPFNPILNVDGMKRFLTMKNGEILLIRNSFQPLHPNKYVLEIQIQKQ